MRVGTELVRVGRILFEDDEFVTLEVAKSDQTLIRVEDGDRFLSMIFLKSDGEGGAEVWLPWETG